MTNCRHPRPAERDTHRDSGVAMIEEPPVPSIGGEIPLLRCQMFVAGRSPERKTLSIVLVWRTHSTLSKAVVLVPWLSIGSTGWRGIWCYKKHFSLKFIVSVVNCSRPRTPSRHASLTIQTARRGSSSDRFSVLSRSMSAQ
jgi:hypothetical protein